MKASFLFAAAILLPAVAPASAAVITVGNTLARACYSAALNRDVTLENLRACDRALDEQPLSPENKLATHVNRGILRMFSGDGTGARMDFSNALKMSPDQPEAWLNMAVLNYRQGNSSEALGMFDRALALKTQQPALAHFGRALANEDRGNFKAAYADLLQAQTLKPGWEAPTDELKRYAVRQP